MPMFVDVPDVPGVPPVFRDEAGNALPPRVLNEDGSATIQGQPTALTDFGQPISPVWGLFQNGSPVVVADNVMSFEYDQEWSIPDYPVEGGAFQTYNKVVRPYDVRLRFSSGGNNDNRDALLFSIENIAPSLDTFDAVMPERTYTDVNIVRYSFGRSERHGVYLLSVDVFLIQVRKTATAAFVNTKSPAGADPIDGGTLQTREPTTDISGFGASVQ